MMEEKFVKHCSDEGIEFFLTDKYDMNDLKRCQEKSVQMMKTIVDIFEKYDVSYILAHGSLLGLIRHNSFIPWDDDCDLFVFDNDYARAIQLLRRFLPEGYIVHNKRTDPIYWPKWTKIRDEFSDTYESLWAIDRKFKFHGICVDILKARVVDRKEIKQVEYTKIKKRRRKRTRKFNALTFRKKIVRFPLYVAGNIKDVFRYAKAAIKGIRSKTKCVGNEGTIIECEFKYEDVFPTKKMVFEGVQVAVPKNPEGVLRSMYGDFMKLPPLEDRKPHFDEVVFFDEEI